MKHMYPFLIALIVSTLFATSAAAAPDRYGCDDLDDYQEAIIDAAPRTDLAWLFTFLDGDPATARPSQLHRASVIMDDWATELDALPRRDVPLAAADYHAAFIAYLGVSSAVLNALATGGPLNAIPYTEAMERVGINLDTANAKGERYCGALWPFGDTDEGSTL